MFEVASRKHSIWLMLATHFANRKDNSRRSIAAPSGRSVQGIGELSPYLQRDLGFRDIDHREHRMR